MNMLSRYRSRDWTGALAAVEQGLAADEENRFKTLYNIYSERIRAFQVTPPPDDWDGAYALEIQIDRRQRRRLSPYNPLKIKIKIRV